MGMPECRGALAAFERIRTELHCDVVCYGATTMARTFCPGYAPQDLPKAAQRDYADHVVIPDGKPNIIVSLDPDGVLGWTSNIIRRSGRPDALVLEVLTEKVSPAYLAYLEDMSISYVFAGESKIDCRLLLTSLRRYFGVNRVLVAGGGQTNWAFLEAGCLDELSLVMAPLADGSATSVSIFERSDFASGEPHPLILRDVRALEASAVWIRYAVAPA